MYKWYLELSLEWDYKITKRKEGHNLIEIIKPGLSNKMIDIDFFRVNLLNDTSFNTDKYREFDYLFVYLFIYLFIGIFLKMNIFRNINICQILIYQL